MTTTPSNLPTPNPTTQGPKKQENLMGAEVYAQLAGLGRFDALLFKKMAAKTGISTRKSMSGWDEFRAGYLNSSSDKPSV
jgi:hypothetical protein